MTLVILVLKFISLVFALWFTQVNIVRTYAKQNIPPINFIIQSVSLAMYLTLQFNF